MDRLTALIDQAEEQGCVNLSQFSELVQELELDGDDLAKLYEQLEERGIELSDDCGQVVQDGWPGPTAVRAAAPGRRQRSAKPHH